MRSAPLNCVFGTPAVKRARQQLRHQRRPPTIKDHPTKPVKPRTQKIAGAQNRRGREARPEEEPCKNERFPVVRVTLASSREGGRCSCTATPTHNSWGRDTHARSPNLEHRKQPVDQQHATCVRRVANSPRHEQDESKPDGAYLATKAGPPRLAAPRV